jgi:Ca2+-binding EF-hand superfamily protein
MDKRWLEEQKQEFREMDEDKDGILTKDELLVTRYPSFFLYI